MTFMSDYYHIPSHIYKHWINTQRVVISFIMISCSMYKTLENPKHIQVLVYLDMAVCVSGMYLTYSTNLRTCLFLRI